MLMNSWDTLYDGIFPEMGRLFGQYPDPPNRIIHPFEAKWIDHLLHADLH